MIVHRETSQAAPAVPRPLTVSVALTEEDLAMVEAFLQWEVQRPNGKPRPQRFQLIRAHGAGAEQVFDRLKILGVIEHRRTGYCWLSESFKAQIKGKPREVAAAEAARA